MHKKVQAIHIIDKRRLLQASMLFAALAIGLFSIAHADESMGKTNDKLKQRPAIGDTTRTLLQSQVDGSIAGPALPMLGAASSLSYQRYLDSYRYPIPETFSRRLEEAKAPR